MMRRLLFAILAGWVLLIVGSCTPQSDAPKGAPSAAGTAGAAKPPTAAAPLGAAPGTAVTPLPPGSKLAIGVTLHPYYSWTKNVVGDAPGVEVRPILPGEIDAGNYQPRPEDIRKIADLDAIVINGIGHDDFITDMIKASGNGKIDVIRPNDGSPTLKSIRGDTINSHTFISFTNAVQQTYVIARALSALRPDLAATFIKGAAAYAARLREIKVKASAQLASAKVKRVVTVHDGYSYLCQELGVEVAGVVEPAHGLVPSAVELGEMVDLVKREKIQVVLSEEAFPEKLLKVLTDATHARVYIISHIAAGQYAADEFEKVMQRNADTLVKALVTDG
jgi:zinc transport system substrate-binding protein